MVFASRPSARAILAGVLTVSLVPALPAQASIAGAVAPRAPAPGPVVVQQVAWAYVTKKSPRKVNLNRAGPAPVGRDRRAGTTYRSFFRFDLRPLAGKKPATAKLRIPAVAPNRCGKNAPALVVWETADFGKTTSWSRQPQWRKRLGVVRAACAGKRYEMDVSAVIARAVSARRASLTLGVRSAAETDPGALVKVGIHPTITAALTPPPPVRPIAPAAPAAVAATPGGACASGAARPTIDTATPVLSTTINDADSALVGARFQWRSLTGPVFGGQSSAWRVPGSTLSVTAPESAFADGYTYAWRVQGLDETTSGPWSPWCEFTVDLPPALPDPEQPPVRSGQPGMPGELGTGGTGWFGTCGQGASRSWITEFQPAFSARIHDPDYQPDDDGVYDPPVPLRATFEWVTSDGTKIGEQHVDRNSGDLFRAWTPPGQFTEGQTYAWHVRAADETGPGPWSPWCEFTIDVTAPTTPPAVTSDEFPNDLAWHDRVGVSGNFDLSAAGDTDVVKFRYEGLGGLSGTLAADRPGGVASLPFTPTGSGLYILTVWAVDRAGKRGAPVRYETRMS